MINANPRCEAHIDGIGVRVANHHDEAVPIFITCRIIRYPLQHIVFLASDHALCKSCGGTSLKLNRSEHTVQLVRWTAEYALRGMNAGIAD